MFRVLARAAIALALGALSAFAALPAQSDAGLCDGCVSGVANYHQTFTMTGPAGQLCYVSALWWRQDGTCEAEWADDGSYTCVPAAGCQFMVQTSCSCGTACQNIVVSVYLLSGALVFSMPSQGVYVVGTPCNFQQWVAVSVYNVATGESTSQLQGVACSACEGGGGGGEDDNDGGGGG